MQTILQCREKVAFATGHFMVAQTKDRGDSFLHCSYKNRPDNVNNLFHLVLVIRTRCEVWQGLRGILTVDFKNLEHGCGGPFEEPFRGYRAI